MDLEMSGLDPGTSTILEIATLVTDGDLNILAEGPDIVIHHAEPVLDAMDAWNKEHHGRSGLTDQVRSSGVTLEEAERRTLTFLRGHAAERESPLCGNSVHQDRLFLLRYMRDLDSFLHYRNIDVSSLKELCRRWYPDLKPPPKRKAHRALDDIRESVEELRFYRGRMFRER